MIDANIKFSVGYTDGSLERGETAQRVLQLLRMLEPIEKVEHEDDKVIERWMSDDELMDAKKEDNSYLARYFDCGLWEHHDLKYAILFINAEYDVDTFYTIADRWLPLVYDSGDFIISYVMDIEYEAWQNPREVEYYDDNPLPKIVPNHPSPHNKPIIDISKNPGRRGFRKGYEEIVASKMWLGERFWQLTGTSKSEAMKALKDYITEHENYLAIKMMDKPFDSDEGEQRDMQIMLRKVLYNR